jgi:hypothetical protein
VKTARKAVPVILAAGLSLPVLTTFLAAGGIDEANGQTCSSGLQPMGDGDVVGASVDLEGTEQASRAQVVVPLSPHGTQASARWSDTQTRNAATITNVARTRALPPRAAVIAVTTAIQESGLNNLGHGDRDSVGLFQQRPSKGWGNAVQLTDPVYAAGRFYDALIEVPGWQTRPLAEVAQSVQRSARPSAYAKWEQAAGALVAGTWGTHAVTSIFTGCGSEGSDDPVVDFSVSNPRTPTQAIATARRAAGETGWYRRCDQFVAQAYGYAYSGSATANEHWNRLVDAGVAHPGDNSPSLGALLFYDTGEPAGHVALYLGNDMVASNDILDSYEGEGKIALVHRADLTEDRWRLQYRGWAEPAFPGAGGTSTI